MLFGVPEWSISVSFLFNTFRCNMFYFTDKFDTESYMEDSVPYCADINDEFVMSNLDQLSTTL